MTPEDTAHGAHPALKLVQDERTMGHDVARTAGAL
jgi:hypothetical protein